MFQTGSVVNPTIAPELRTVLPSMRWPFQRPSVWRQQDIILAVAVHVGDAGELPVGAALEGDGAAFGLDGGSAVHGVVHPSAVDVAEEDVVHPVAVQVADGVGEALIG